MTFARVFAVLQQAVRDGACLELDLRTETGARTVGVARVEAEVGSRGGNGFCLIGADGGEVLRLAYPYVIDWYLPAERSRDGWARIRFGVAVRVPGRRTWIRHSWLRWLPVGTGGPGSHRVSVYPGDQEGWRGP